MEEKAVALEMKNKELEERKRQIEEELNNLNAEEYDEDIEFGGHQEEPSPYEEEFEKEEQPEKDIIGQLEAVKKATEERNQNKLA